MTHDVAADGEQSPFDARVVLASLSGQSDAEWARRMADYADAAMLGGIAIDERTRRGAREMVDRDREEFLPADPIAFIDEQIGSLAEDPIRPGINVRSATLDPIRQASRVCARHDAILEINAHCRQDEICQAGAGQALLSDENNLREQVIAAKSSNPIVSVKVRTEVTGVDLPALSQSLDIAGADIIHVDAMDSEHVLGDIVRTTDATVIANNGVRDRPTVDEYLEYGADAVSVGRPSDDPEVLDRVRRATDEWFENNPPAAGVQK